LRLLETDLAGVLICDPEPVTDPRGFFARLVDADVLAAAGVHVDARQRSAAGNHRAGTIRGLHWQDERAPETKLVRCTAGAVLDVVVDVRPSSPTYGRHVAVELSADNRRTLVVPPLCAHGYQTLTDDAEVAYDIDGEYRPETAHGLRYDDPTLGIDWPIGVTAINDRDRSWPLLAP
jgi:dTDP-4-dehydrorhamnose 3,5-epimerase